MLQGLLTWTIQVWRKLIVTAGTDDGRGRPNDVHGSQVVHDDGIVDGDCAGTMINGQSK